VVARRRQPSVAPLRLAEVPAVLLLGAEVVPGRDGTERAPVIVEGVLLGTVLCYHDVKFHLVNQPSIKLLCVRVTNL